MWFALLTLVLAWDRWEIAVPKATEAVLSGPRGESFVVPTFRSASGERLRFAFPSGGLWRWRAGDATGEVRVRKGGGSLLRRRGFLKVSENKRYLTYSDGTPFFWMGDTAWYGGVKASEQEWAAYLDVRAKQGFTVVQISAGRVPAGWRGPQPFASDGTPDEEYWSRIDRKVRMANEKGLLVVLVGLGRPTDEKDWAHVTRREYARYLAGLFAGDHVVFSPNFDGPYRAEYDELANNLYAVDKRHLITQHPNTQKGQNELYVSNAYLAFSGLQSGHHGGRLDRVYGAARDWALNLWRLEPRKPVINIEGMYDGRGSDEGAAWRAQDVRKCGWISWLSGALGYTYGAGETDRKVKGTHGGVWGWNQDDTWDHWSKVVRWKSASHMTAMRRILERLEWWRLEPAHELVTSEDEHAVAAASKERDLIVAYVPSGAVARFALQGRYREELWDPISGKRGTANAERVIVMRRMQ